jgi:hypothetical protein
MNDLETLRKLSATVVDADREKFDRVYNEILFPMMKDRAERLKKNELVISDNNNNPPMARQLVAIMGERSNLQSIVQTGMKPYLEEKGFKVILCSPSYFVYVRW